MRAVLDAGADRIGVAFDIEVGAGEGLVDRLAALLDDAAGRRHALSFRRQRGAELHGR